MQYVMAVDIGTGSGRAVIFNRQGEEISSAQEEWLHPASPDFPGAVDFDTAAGWELICRCTKKALSRANLQGSDIAALACSSMREGFVVFDRQGKELWACTNVDSRAGTEAEELRNRYPALETELYAKTGQTFALGALPRLLWLKKHQPEIFAKMHRIAMLSDWAAAKFSGIIACEASNAGTTGLFSLMPRGWLHQETETVLGRSDFLPPAASTGSILGTVTETAAKQSGLAPTTLTASGGGDCQIAALGLGLTQAGSCAVLGGTFWQQIVNVEPALRDPKQDLRINPHVLPALNQAEGISFFIGLIMRWFRDTFAQEELSQVQEPGDAYQLLEQQAAAVPAGAYGVIPIFSDAMHYSRWIHAAPSFLNLSLEPARSGKAVLFRALQENACIAANENLQAIFSLSGRTPDSLIFAAGAAKSRHWAQILSDVTGITVKVPKVKEATALGCAAAAGTAAGWTDSPQMLAQEWLEIEEIFTPNPENHYIYQQAAARWRTAYRVQLQLAESGITTAMWRAPGV